jgi:creatinine amidohydrolase
VQAIGKSNEHQHYPGTLTLSMETVVRAWTEIGESVARTGCRKLVFMNSHGGNVAPLAAVARDLRVRLRMLAVHAAWHAFGYPEGLFTLEELAHGVHGGDAETSLMLAFRRDAVRMSEARNFVSSAVGFEREFKRLRVTQPVGVGWMANDLNELGAAGDASKATAAKGEALADYGVEAFIELLRDVVAFDLARLGQRPLAAQSGIQQTSESMLPGAPTRAPGNQPAEALVTSAPRLSNPRLAQLELSWRALGIVPHFHQVHHFTGRRRESLASFIAYCGGKEIRDENSQTLARALEVARQMMDGEEFNEALEKAWATYPRLTG